MTPVHSVLARSSSERSEIAEAIAERLHGAMALLGVLFALVVVGDTLVRAQSPWDTVFFIAGWVIWLVFVVEFTARAVVAPSTGAFLKRNWWQLLFLLLPFLGFLRIISAIRVARVGRVVSSAIRTGRSATARMRSRLGWLIALTLIVILAGGEILYEFAGFTSFGDALHAAAYGAITGEPVGRNNPTAQVVEIALAVYSVVVFAALAGILGAYFLGRGEEERESTFREAGRD
jgi:voltage-gated potassium channel